MNPTKMRDIGGLQMGPAKAEQPCQARPNHIGVALSLVMDRLEILNKTINELDNATRVFRMPDGEPCALTMNKEPAPATQSYIASNLEGIALRLSERNAHLQRILSQIDCTIEI